MTHPTDNISNTPTPAEQAKSSLSSERRSEAAQVPSLPQPPTRVTDPRQWGSYTAKMFAEISPLYETFAQHLVGDAEVEELVALVDSNQPILVTFFTAVNTLLYGEPGDPLAAFYPSLATSARPAEEAYPFFRAFCLGHQEALRQMLPTMRLQTNEVTRCANLLPAFELVSRRVQRRPLAMIEIGCSAGLNMRWDQYRYSYRQGIDPEDKDPWMVSLCGNPFSAVLVRCTLEGTERPPLPHGLAMPLVAQRAGIDLAPLDVTKKADQRLLRACIWPEEAHRHALLRAAIKMATQGEPLPIYTGDACEVLPELLAALPPDVVPCLYHSYALEQGPVQVRDQILARVLDASVTHDVYRISLEMNAAQWQAPRLELFHYHGGKLARYEHLAECSVHGERMRWLAS